MKIGLLFLFRIDIYDLVTSRSLVDCSYLI